MKRILFLGPLSVSIQLWTRSSMSKRARRRFARDSSGVRDLSGKMALCSSPMCRRTFSIVGGLDQRRRKSFSSRAVEFSLTPILSNPDRTVSPSTPNGRLLLCQSGGRRVVRLEADGHTETVLADRFEGRRFNNPNDLVCHSSGAVYFSDPSYGFKGHEASRCGKCHGTAFTALLQIMRSICSSGTLPFPNGLAFSPDEKTLYIAVSDPKSPRVMAFEVQADGLLGDVPAFL